MQCEVPSSRFAAFVAAYFPRFASALWASVVGSIQRAACNGRPVMPSEAACCSRKRMRLARKRIVAKRVHGCQSARKFKRERARCRRVVLRT
jgi:hypothetical protein